jgi:hypothetical protein
MNSALPGKSLLLGALAFLSILFFQGCNPPVTLKTIDLTPSGAPPIDSVNSGGSGSEGFCFGTQNIPPEPLSPGPNEVMVGFDDFFNPGTDPFPCKSVRASVFRGGVVFDLSQFDSIVAANLLFNVDNSLDRSGGEATGQSPPQSVATTLGMGTQAFSRTMPDDNEATLPSTTPSIDVGVSTQVRQWISHSHTNFGFVIGGPRPALPDPPQNPPEDNDAQMSWYSGFKLRIMYNPAQNPRAPQ